MRALVIFDSNFGNTKLIADAITSELGPDAKLVSVAECTTVELEGIDLLVVGSPIVGWRPSEKMGKFLAGLSKGQFQELKAAAFDTRMKTRLSGDAARKIAGALEKAGAKILVPPQAFYVKGKEGPLVEGEIERATAFAKAIMESAKAR